MIINSVDLKSFSVLNKSKSLSISLSADDKRQEVVEEIKKIKGQICKFYLEYIVQNEEMKDQTGKKSLEIRGKVQSLSLTDTINFTIHTDIATFVVYTLMEVGKNGKNLSLKFSSLKEKKLLDLMDMVAKEKGIKPEEALKMATTFRGDGNEVVEGKTSIYDLSEKFKTVAIDKLKRMLGSNKEKERCTSRKYPNKGRVAPKTI